MKTVLVVLALLLTGLVADAAALTQPERPPAESDAAPPKDVTEDAPALGRRERAAPQPAPVDLDEAVAARLARQAVLFVRGLERPAAEDFEMAALVMGMALELDPDNEPLLRLQIESWRQAGAEAEAAQATARLVRLNPTDTVAQLRLISDRIGDLQRIEDRIAAYENLLGPAGERLDASIRSRLAFDAALLVRETGDEDRFLDLLSTSLELDQTNKPAALLATTLLFERNEDPVARAEMLVQMILADPIDATAHLRLARLLLEHGAYEGADRFLEIALTLRTRRGVEIDEAILDDVLTVGWGVRGAEAYLEALAEDDAAQRYAVDVARRRIEQQGEDPSEIPDYVPNPVQDRARVAMASAIGDAEQARATLERFSQGVLDSLAQRREAGEISPELAGDIATRVASELVRLRTLSGLNLEEAETALDRLEASGQTTLRAEAIARYRGLIAAHRGERAAAETLLGPIAENGDDLALLGLAIAAEEADDRQTAVGRYAQVARRAPGNAIGLWARERLSRLLGAPIRPSDVARRLNRLAADAPRQLDRMAADTTEYLTLRVELPDGRLDPLAPVLARVEILNGGIFPLAIGADAPVVSRVLLAPKLAVSGRVVPAGNVPEIISMNRKLRLRPNETVVADAWLTAGALGALVDAMAPIATSIRVQAIQGFQWAEERESYVAGPFSLADSSDAVWRRPERVEPTAQEIVESIGSATGADLLRAVLEARWLFLQPAPAAEAEAMIARHRSLAEALAARYSSMSDAEQAFTLLMVPSAAQVPPAAAIEEAALAEPPAPLSTIVMLLSRAGSLDHPAFERARSLDDEAARGIAERLTLRLEIAERLAQQRRSAADGD